MCKLTALRCPPYADWLGSLEIKLLDKEIQSPRLSKKYGSSKVVHVLTSVSRNEDTLGSINIVLCIPSLDTIYGRVVEFTAQPQYRRKKPSLDQGLERLEHRKSLATGRNEILGVQQFALFTTRLEYPGCHLIDYIQWQQSP